MKTNFLEESFIDFEMSVFFLDQSKFRMKKF